MGETINLTPNYPAVYERFMDCFEHSLKRTVKRATDPDEIGELRARLVELNIAAQSISSVKMLEDFRKRLSAAVTLLADKHDKLMGNAPDPEDDPLYASTDYFGPDGRVKESL